MSGGKSLQVGFCCYICSILCVLRPYNYPPSLLQKFVAPSCTLCFLLLITGSAYVCPKCTCKLWIYLHVLYSVLLMFGRCYRMFVAPSCASQCLLTIHRFYGKFVAPSCALQRFTDCPLLLRNVCSTFVCFTAFY